MIQFDEHRSWFEKLFRLLAARAGWIGTAGCFFLLNGIFPFLEINIRIYIYIRIYYIYTYDRSFGHFPCKHEIPEACFFKMLIFFCCCTCCWTLKHVKKMVFLKETRPLKVEKLNELGVYLKLHPWKLTWNLKITTLKRKIIFQTSIFGSMLIFRGVLSGVLFYWWGDMTGPMFHQKVAYMM